MKLSKKEAETDESFFSESKSSQKIDPLFVIFEQHLFNFQDPDSDRQTFIHNIVMDYIAYLRKSNITVPKSLEQPIVEELSEQVKCMLLKKIYGCPTIENFQKNLPSAVKRRARNRYSRLNSK